MCTPCRAFLFRPYKIRGNLPHRCARSGKARCFCPARSTKHLLSPGSYRTYSTKITRQRRQPLASSHIKPYNYTGFFLLLQEYYAIFFKILRKIFTKFCAVFCATCTKIKIFTFFRLFSRVHTAFFTKKWYNEGVYIKRKESPHDEA